MLALLTLTESFRMQDIVKNVTFLNGTSFDIVRNAIDRDHFTYAQVEEGMHLSIILNQRTNFSCFYMEARGGISHERVFLPQNRFLVIFRIWDKLLHIKAEICVPKWSATHLKIHIIHLRIFTIITYFNVLKFHNIKHYV